MNPVKTKDGSITFFNEEFGEHYHATHGAEEEAVKKFAQPLKPYIKSEEPVILDLCFGLGYNTAAFIDLYYNKFRRIKIIALEKDKKILQELLELDTGFACFFQLKVTIQNMISGEKTEETFHFKETPITIQLIIGDAQKTIESIGMVDAVLFDPFSPKAHPGMWSKEFLTKIKRVMKPKAALTTYSCAKTFRDTLRELDFEVVNGPIVGRRAPSTIAVKKDL